MNSQTDQIEADLRAGHSLTALEALRLYGCNRLAARIAELRRGGMMIESTLVEVKTDHGGTARVAKYRMVKDGQQEMFS